MKQFNELLKDTLEHVTTVSDPDFLHWLREKGIVVDSEGIFVLPVGNNSDIEFRIQPTGTDRQYIIGLYVLKKQPYKGLEFVVEIPKNSVE